MQQSKMVSKEQVFLLILSSLAGCFSYNGIRGNVYIGNMVWISIITSIVPGFLLVVWFFGLTEKGCKQPIFSIIEKNLSKILALLLKVIYYLITFILAICLINLFTQTLKMFFLPNTPSWVTMLVIISMCGVFADSGLKRVGMLCSITATLTIINFYGGFGLAFVRAFKFENLMPIFDVAPFDFVRVVMFNLASICEGILLLIVLTRIMPNDLKYRNWAINGILVWGIIYTTSGIIFTGMMKTEMLEALVGSGVDLAKLIQIGSFIRGLEVFILIGYQLQITIKLTISIYCMKEMSLSIFNSKKHKIHLVVSVILIFIISSYINSYNTAYFISLFIYTYILLPFTLIVLLLASVGKLVAKRRKRAWQNEK